MIEHYLTSNHINQTLSMFTLTERLEILTSLNTQQLELANVLFKETPEPRFDRELSITASELEEFKNIYFEEFGEVLSNLEATQKATNVINGVKLVLGGSTRPVSGVDSGVRKGDI